jgi:cyclic pyranopterin phosphate synthase
MPEDTTFMPADQLLTIAQIVDTVKHSVSQGVDKVRITGGEPTVRPDIVELVASVAAIPGIKDLAMTTNGIMLQQLAQPLAHAGLMRVNISLDSMDPERFRAITRRGDIQKVFDGIEAAKKAGLSPIKINCVIRESSDEPDAQAVRAYCEANGLQIRYIREMNLSMGEFWHVEGGDGGDCENCNRMRLTADGKFKPCLFNNLEFDTKTLGIEEGLKMSLDQKPKDGSVNTQNRFNNIGG